MRYYQDFDPLSQTAYYVECMANNKRLMSGTCFFLRRININYLVTNWHIVTGKDPNTGEYLGPYAVSPEKLHIYIFKDIDQIEQVLVEVELQDNNGKNKWLEHPIHHQRVDVVVIEVAIPDGCIVYSPEECIESYNEETKAVVKDDIYIIGFPFGLNQSCIFPIWKRASIASEPIIDIDNLPKILVDTASRPGMSGSPVIYKERRQFGISDAIPGTPGSISSYNFMQFIGIYSGRIGATDEILAQLGIVWKKESIEEIIEQKID